MGRKLTGIWRGLIDIREGEMGRTVYMSLYLMFVLFAYYILKPVSRAMFLNQFDIDKLPYLYILMAVVGGILAYLYTRVAVQSSLQAAVTGTTIVTLLCLVGFWLLLPHKYAWMLYFFNIWVSLFSVVLVAQGWLVASNVFNSREAKRLYGVLATSATAGAAFGGSFTTLAVSVVGTNNLVLACGVMMILAYISFRMVAVQKGVSLKAVKAAEAEEEEFSITDILSSLKQYRHLQVIIGIMLMTFIVDVLVEFQFQAAAKQRYSSAVYQTQRTGDFSYGFVVRNEDYQVLLKFVEIEWERPGQRVFDVKINGKTVLQNFDIAKEAKGPFHAVEKKFKADVDDEKIVIEFVGKVGKAEVCGIEVSAPGQPPIRVNAGGPAYKDPRGLEWGADMDFSGGSTSETTRLVSGTKEEEQLLAKFMGSFYGIYVNLVSFVFQFLLTGAIVRAVGVGGTLQILPVSMMACSVGIFAYPGLILSSIGRLMEAATRYSFNRTGMELLYLPLPIELRNRTKAFVDIFVDRLGRGLGGGVLILTTTILALNLRQVSLFVILFCLIWVFLSYVAKKEYILTVRKRLESRRLDLESVRLGVNDPDTIALLEQAAEGANARQASYALETLSEVRGYHMEPTLHKLAGSPFPEVRAKAFEIARRTRISGLETEAVIELSMADDRKCAESVRAAVQYLILVSPDARELGRRFLESPFAIICRSALEALQETPERAEDLITREWLTQAAEDPDAGRRAMAAYAIGVRGDQGIELLHKLLTDREGAVVREACLAAGAVQNRSYLPVLVRLLGDSRIRGAAIAGLARFGSKISGTLGDMLEDGSVDASIRRQIPRVLKATPDQKNVDVLLKCIDVPDLSVRQFVLRALNRLRESAPNLDYGVPSIQKQMLNEARTYFELHAALETIKESTRPRTAVGLLCRTIEERLDLALERLFRLLGLCYPPKEIYSAYLAMSRGKGEQRTTALEFLDNVLDREVKRYVLPLLDSSERMGETGQNLFHIEIRTPEGAIRDLIRSRDAWLVCCAMAAAAELNLRSLASEISAAGRGAGREASEIARAAVASLS